MEFNNTSNEAQDAAIQYFRLSNSLEHSSIRGQFPPSTLHIGTSTSGKKNDKKTWGHRVAHLTAAGQVIDLTGSAREVHDRICVQNAASRIAIGEVGLLNMAYFLHNFEDEADRIALLRKLRESQPESLCIAVDYALKDLPREIALACLSTDSEHDLMDKRSSDVFVRQHSVFTLQSLFELFEAAGWSSIKVLPLKAGRAVAIASASLDPRQRSAMTAEELLAEV